MCDNLPVAELNIPEEPDKTVSTVIGEDIVFFTLEHEDSPSNPLEDMDGEGRIYSFNPRHINSSRDAVQKALADPDRVMLDYFEHGLCKWDVGSGSLKGTPDFEWDGSANAGVWVPDHATVEEANGNGLKGKERAEFMAKRAEGACELYTDFCNGEVYYYSIKAFRTLLAPEMAANPEVHSAVLDLPSDYRRSMPIYEDSCGGLYGYSSRDEALKEAATVALESLAALAKEAAPAI